MVGHWLDTDRLNIDTEISSQIESKYGKCVSVGRVMKLEEASVTMDGEMDRGLLHRLGISSYQMPI